MTNERLNSEKAHLAKLLEAIQRCAYFLDYSENKLSWPVDGEFLATRKKDVELFETLAAINERFAKLQDSLAAAMRHSIILMSEPADSFLRILAFFEKQGVITSIPDWQVSRTARNLAAHDYETNYAAIAEHFNTLHELSGMLYYTAKRLLELCDTQLGITPASADFSSEFDNLVSRLPD